ncbi:MAG: hypothetical protein K2X38_12320 [Gemmataceae bacterium]|nr:hypothetical protein [Gemmataceae bacterium]
MTRITLDGALRERLGDLQNVVEVEDESGRVVGRFVPATDPFFAPMIDDAEIERRLAKGGGRSLQDILADLEARA